MRHFLLLLAPIFLFSFCTPEPCLDCGTPPPPPPVDSTGPFEILWMVPLNPDTAECLVSPPVVYNGKVMYSMLFYVDGYELFRSVDAKNGAPLWAWDPPYPVEVTSRESRDTRENLFLLTHIDTYYCLDLNTGQVVWQSRIGTDTTTGNNRLSVINDYIYSEHSAKFFNDTLSYFVRANIYTGVWDTLFSLKGEGGYKPFLMSPSLWINPAGDSVLILQNRQWNFPLSDGKIDLWAFNMNTREFIWKADDIDPIGNSSVEPPLIYDNNVFFLSQTTLYCLDAALGTVKWSWKVQLPMDDLMWTNMLIIEGKLFIKPSHEKFLYVFDPNTGEIIQKYPTPGPGSVQMEYYNGILYYSTDSDGKLYALKLATGEWIWNHPTPNRYRYGPWRGNAQFDKVKVSPEHNCLFVGDRYFMMAIKLIQ